MSFAHKIQFVFFFKFHWMKKKMLLAHMSQIYKRRRSKGLITWRWENPVDGVTRLGGVTRLSIFNLSF